MKKKTLELPFYLPCPCLISLLLDILDEEGVEGGGEGRDYIESPMSDGTIEEDFEEALAR